LPKEKTQKVSGLQDPHELVGAKDNRLEEAIGRQVRSFRKKLDITVVDLANQANLSAGMLSKIENGLTSPSLATLRALADALKIPVTALFASYDEVSDAMHVKAGEGLKIERRGTRAGHQYQLLGHSTHPSIAVEPYLITITEASDVFPRFQHAGLEFLYILEGTVKYRHGDTVYELEAGDSLFFDADKPHGPEQLVQLPLRFLSAIAWARE
jgi:transcriptional regulator with XRE-family HTH domain